MDTRVPHCNNSAFSRAGGLKTPCAITVWCHAKVQLYLERHIKYERAQCIHWTFCVRQCSPALFFAPTHVSLCSYGTSPVLLRVLADRARLLQRFPTAWGSHASLKALQTKGKQHALQDISAVMKLSDILTGSCQRGNTRCAHVATKRAVKGQNASHRSFVVRWEPICCNISNGSAPMATLSCKWETRHCNDERSRLRGILSLDIITCSGYFCNTCALSDRWHGRCRKSTRSKRRNSPGGAARDATNDLGWNSRVFMMLCCRSGCLQICRGLYPMKTELPKTLTP